jgi:hypothetical protein
MGRYLLGSRRGEESNGTIETSKKGPISECKRGKLQMKMAMLIPTLAPQPQVQPFLDERQECIFRLQCGSTRCVATFRPFP